MMRHARNEPTDLLLLWLSLARVNYCFNSEREYFVWQDILHIIIQFDIVLYRCSLSENGCVKAAILKKHNFLSLYIHIIADSVVIFHFYFHTQYKYAFCI